MTTTTLIAAPDGCPHCLAGCSQCRPDCFRAERLRFVAAGQTTLGGVAAAMRARASYLEKLRRHGWKLARPVADGVVHLYRDEPPATTTAGA